MYRTVSVSYETHIIVAIRTFDRHCSSGSPSLLPKNFILRKPVCMRAKASSTLARWGCRSAYVELRKTTSSRETGLGFAIRRSCPDRSAGRSQCQRRPTSFSAGFPFVRAAEPQLRSLPLREGKEREVTLTWVRAQRHFPRHTLPYPRLAQ